VRFTADTARRKVSAFDLTPMIDVVLHLIIFFMYTTQFTSVVRSQLDLPEERGEIITQDQRPELVIDLRADGVVLVAGVVLDDATLAAMVAAELRSAGADPSAIKITLRADRAVPTGRVDAIAKILADLDISSWRTATEATGTPVNPADPALRQGGAP